MLSISAMFDAVVKAKDAVGGPAALARALGSVTPQAVSQWKKAPAERVLEIERVTGISRHELRPDIFGPEPASPLDADRVAPAGPERPPAHSGPALSGAEAAE